jgi:hypothetical protein
MLCELGEEAYRLRPHDLTFWKSEKERSGTLLIERYLAGRHSLWPLAVRRYVGDARKLRYLGQEERLLFSL